MQNNNIINNYNYNYNYNTFLMLGHCSIPVSYDVCCFSYNQSLSIINCIYITIWIKLIKHQHTFCVQNLRSNSINIIQKCLIYVLHVQFHKHRTDSIWCILSSTCQNEYALSEIVLIQLTLCTDQTNANQSHIYNRYDLSNHVLCWHTRTCTHKWYCYIYI